jgi:UDP-2,4-diacetamido-2,4,6-trideoxy-beta-L-altropyranose hydrolase
MQLFIRAEGNPSIGLGHVMRCYALAEACQLLNISVSFLCSQQTSDFLKSRRGFNSGIITLANTLQTDSDKTTNSESNELISVLTCDAVLLLDGYQFDHIYQQAIKHAGIKFAYFDDINSFYQSGLKHCADIIINGADSALSLNYELNATHSKLCLGSEYLLLRQEFHNLHPIAISERDSLLINFGGADIHNYSTQLLIELEKQGFSAPVKVVTGAAFQHQETLNRRLQDDLSTSSMQIEHIHDAQQMATLMQNSRLAICAAGGTQFELLACATPSILVVVADNQLPASKHAAQQGWCDIIEWQQQVDISALAAKIVADWQNQPEILCKFDKALQQQRKLTFNGGENILSALNELAQSEEYV